MIEEMMNKKWEYDLGKDISEDVIQPLVKNEQVIFHSNNSLFSLNIETGDEQWKTKIEGMSGNRLLLLFDELIVVHRVVKTDLFIEGIPSFRDEILGINSAGEIVWSLDLPSRINKNGFFQEGNTLWLLGHPEEEVQLLHNVNLENGTIRETLELPYRANRVTLVNDQFVLSYYQADETCPGIYLYNKETSEVKVLNNSATHEVFHTNDMIIYSSGRIPEFKLVIMDINTSDVVSQRNILTETIVYDGSFIYFLEERESIHLCAMDTDQKVKWEIEVPDDAELIYDSDEFISVLLDYDYLIVSKDKGEVVLETEGLSTPTSEQGNIYIKEKNKFLKYAHAL